MGNVKWQLVVAVMALTTSVASAEVCFVGRQRCEYIGLAEIHVEKQTLTHGYDSTTVDVAAGFMSQSGFGGTFGFRAYDFAPDTYIMARGRYRHWLTPLAGLDLSIAPMVADHFRTGLNLQVGAEYADQIGVVVDFDVVSVDSFDRTASGSRTLVGASIGIRFSNFAAIPAALVGLLAISTLSGE